MIISFGKFVKKMGIIRCVEVKLEFMFLEAILV